MDHIKHRPDIEAEDIEMNARQLSNDLFRLLDEHSIVFDIGANRGQFAKTILDCTDVKNIFSFEPVPDAYSDLCKLSQLHPQIIPISKAVSNVNGPTTFYITKSDVGSSLLAPLPGQPSQWLTLDTKQTVENIRLDKFIENTIVNACASEIDLLKSDTQGTDIHVLEGAGKYLKPEYIKAVLVEVNFTNFYINQKPFYEIFSLLNSSGYRMASMYPYRASDKWFWWADVLFIGK